MKRREEKRREEKRNRRPDALLPLILLLLPSPSPAGDDPMLAAGFAPNTILQGDDTGFVNVLSGGLTLTIPIGPTYQVSEALSYGLTLTYSSTLLNWLEGEGGDPKPWYTRGRSPIGWGWVAHFGRIASQDPTYSAGAFLGYQDQSGTWHTLYPGAARPASQVPCRGRAAAPASATSPTTTRSSG